MNGNLNEYFFIYNFDGKLIENPNDRKNIGQNYINIKDANGKEVIKELINTSKKILVDM